MQTENCTKERTKQEKTSLLRREESKEEEIPCPVTITRPQCRRYAVGKKEPRYAMQNFKEDRLCRSLICICGLSRLCIASFFCAFDNFVEPMTWPRVIRTSCLVRGVVFMYMYGRSGELARGGRGRRTLWRRVRQQSIVAYEQVG